MSRALLVHPGSVPRAGLLFSVSSFLEGLRHPARGGIHGSWPWAVNVPKLQAPSPTGAFYPRDFFIPRCFYPGVGPAAGLVLGKLEMHPGPPVTEECASNVRAPCNFIFKS